MATISGGPPPINPNLGVAKGSPLAPPPSQPAVPGDSVVVSGSPPPAPPAAPPQASSVTYPNQVQVTRWKSGTQDVGLKAVLPSIAGGGQFLPIPIALEVKAGEKGEEVKAYLSDPRGEKLVDAQGQPQELPVYKVGGQYLLPTDKSNAGGAPYILIEPEAGGGIAYGLTDGLRYQDLQQGYQIARSELMESDNTRVMRFNEQAGPQKAPPQGFTFIPLGMMANMFDAAKQQQSVGRTRDLQEVRVSPQGGQPTAADVHYDFLQEGERPTPGTLNRMWEQVKGKGGRKEVSRTFQVNQEGNINLVPASGGKAAWDYFINNGSSGTIYPKQTMTVRPLSADYATPQGQAWLAQALTGGQALTTASAEPGPTAGGPAADPTAALANAIQGKFDQQFNPLANKIFGAEDSPHRAGLQAALEAGRKAAEQGQNPEMAYVGTLSSYAQEQLKALDAAAQASGNNPAVLTALQPQKQAFSALVSSGGELLGMLAQHQQSITPTS